MSEHAPLPALTADVIEWERYAVALRADNDRLRAAITTAVEALRSEHRRGRYASVAHRAHGCVTCWPNDNDWPCVSRMVADDLAAAVGGDDGLG